jgi:hypothetical protein
VKSYTNTTTTTTTTSKAVLHCYELSKSKNEYYFENITKSWTPISEWCIMDQNIFYIRVSKCFERISLSDYYFLQKRQRQNDYEKYSDIGVQL